VGFLIYLKQFKDIFSEEFVRMIFIKCGIYLNFKADILENLYWNIYILKIIVKY